LGKSSAVLPLSDPSDPADLSADTQPTGLIIIARYNRFATLLTRGIFSNSYQPRLPRQKLLHHALCVSVASEIVENDRKIIMHLKCKDILIHLFLFIIKPQALQS
jgi:hypothetical protein